MDDGLDAADTPPDAHGMRHPSIVLERATAERFDEEGYLLANPDVAAWARAPGDARLHLERHGIAERRQQASRAFLDAAAARRIDKYRRFADILDAARGDGGTFRFLARDGAFPVGYGGDAVDLAQYDREPATAGMTQFVDAIARDPHGRYLDVGCGYRPELQQNCLYLDVYPSRSADIVMAPACVYPIADASLDGIGCFAVLEHVPEPWRVADEFRRMLKPGGMLFVDWPFLQPVHGFPSHYYNATQAGLARLFDDGFEPIDLATRDNQTPDRALTWLLRGWAEGIGDDAVRRELLGKTVAELLAEPPRAPFWKRVLAATPPAVRTTYACGNTLVARRR